jgi:hypothetical protein
VQAQMRASKFNVLVTTYEYIIKDKAVLSKVGSNCSCASVLFIIFSIRRQCYDFLLKMTFFQNVALGIPTTQIDHKIAKN